MSEQHTYECAYIGGAFVQTEKHLDIVNPADERVIGTAPACGPSDVDAAVAAARGAFDARGEGSWSEWTCARRAALLRALAAEVKAQKMGPLMRIRRQPDS